MSKKKNKQYTVLKIKKQKTHKNNYYGGKTASIVGGIYSYKKHKKPKRIGKQCFYFNSDKLTCRLKGQFCTNASTCVSFTKSNPAKINKSKNKPILNKENKKYTSLIGVTAIVINDNRKCINDSHNIIDVEAIIRIVKPTGEIINHTTQAAYCEQCDTYFLLKSDLKSAKKIGVLLCQIIDKNTYINEIKSTKTNNGTESRIHQLGYNVQKGSGLTDRQREVVIANMIENTDISKHEISSHIQRCINQHKKQQNYQDAVRCWQHDYEFISNYKYGDLPEVIIEKIKIGR